MQRYASGYSAPQAPVHPIGYSEQLLVYQSARPIVISQAQTAIQTTVTEAPLLLPLIFWARLGHQ
jgi:hypothetical protein